MSENLPAITLSDVQVMAKAVATSKLFGLSTPDQALALMLISQAEGRHPALAARDYHIINNRPTLKADAMLARFLAEGGRVRWISYTDERVEGEFSHPFGGTVKVDWTPERARRAGITSEMHKKYPRQMLKARVISEGIRVVWPGVVCGMYTPEEMQDMDRPAEPRDVTPEPMPVRTAEALHEPEQDAAPSPTADEMIEEIVATAAEHDMQSVCRRLKSDYDRLSAEDQARVRSARDGHRAALRGASNAA